MDLLNKFNTLVDTSTQAVEDTRRIFGAIEKVMGQDVTKHHFSILALTDVGFSDPSFVQMEIKKEYMRTLRKRVCEYFDGESADVTVYFAHHKKNRKCREVKINRYVKYLTDKEVKKSKKMKKHHKKKHHKHDSDSDDSDVDDSDCDSDDSDSDVDDSEDECDSDDEYNNINISVQFVKYNDLNQYNKLTGDFDAFYIGKQNLVTNLYYKKLMTAVGEYAADVNNADNVAALTRIVGVNDLKNVVIKDMRPGKNTNSGKLFASYTVNDDLKMLTGLNIRSVPQQMVFYYMVSGNLF